MHVMDANMKTPAYNTCLNAQLRRTMRAVGKLYDAALRPAQIKATQFTVLAVFAYHTELTVTSLADAMGMDRTTLTRNLQPLLREGWLAVAGDKDARVKVVKLTPRGRAKLEEATPLWELAQAAVTEKLGVVERADLMAGLSALEPG